MAMPCMVPREWISPPEGDNQDGVLVNEDEADYDEDTAMLAHGSSTAKNNNHCPDNDTDASYDSGTNTEVQNRTQRQKDRAERGFKTTARSSMDRDASGWPIPASERAPLPKNDQVW